MLQIPQYVVEMLSAKGKGYVEAAMKIAEGHKLVEEGTLEIAALDGKAMKAGGVDVTAVVKGLAAPAPKAKDRSALRSQITPDRVKAILRGGRKGTPELAKALGRSVKQTREIVASVNGVVNVGSRTKMLWSLRPAGKPRQAKRARQAACNAADPAQQRRDEDKIVALLAEKPGLTIGGLMKQLGRSYYPVDRAIKSLIKTGRLKPSVVVMEKTHRKLQTWVPAGHGA